MPASGPHITIVGGGSVAWAPDLVRDMMLTPALNGARVVLYDLDRKAADLVKAFLDKLANTLGVKMTIVATNQQARALRGADYVVITISTGGLDAMGHDLAIPEKFGIYHTVGDTTGPGGWARFIRNFDVFMELGKAINRQCPEALIFNYTNPMATLTDVLARVCANPVVGLCHGLFENLEFIKLLYKLKSEDKISLRYAGLNHFFFITQGLVGNRDILVDLARKLRHHTLTDLAPPTPTDLMGFHSNQEVATELFHQTGTMPYLGDRHTCEFLPQYLTDRRQIKRYQLVRTSISLRRRLFHQRLKSLKRMIEGRIPKSFQIRSREAAADMIDAHVRGDSFIDVGNLPNIGQIDNLPRKVVVETAVRVDRNGFSPVAFGSLPASILAMIQPHAQGYQMAVDACFASDRKGVTQALRVDPLCSHLDGEKLRNLADRLLHAHRRYIKAI